MTPPSLKAYNQSRYFREQAHVFAKSGVIIETISEQITSASEKALLHLYKGTDDHNFDSFRNRMFCQKVASSRFHIKPEVLPPTPAAAKYQLFHQVRLWMGENLSVTEWGWGSRINGCNQRTHILDVRQVNCHHLFAGTVKQVVRHFDAVAKSMDLPVENVGD